MSNGNGDLPLEDSLWQQLVGTSLPALVWSTDVCLRIATCHAHPLNQLACDSQSLVGTTLFELFQTKARDSRR